MKNHLPKFLRVLILFIFLILLIVFGVLFYAFKIEPYLLRTKQYTLNADFTKPLKIVQVSDIQISKHFTIENLKKVINKKRTSFCLPVISTRFMRNIMMMRH